MKTSEIKCPAPYLPFQGRSDHPACQFVHRKEHERDPKTQRRKHSPPKIDRNPAIIPILNFLSIGHNGRPLGVGYQFLSRAYLVRCSHTQVSPAFVSQSQRDTATEKMALYLVLGQYRMLFLRNSIVEPPSARRRGSMA